MVKMNSIPRSEKERRDFKWGIANDEARWRKDDNSAILRTTGGTHESDRAENGAKMVVYVVNSEKS